MRVLFAVVLTGAAVAFGQPAGSSPNDKLFAEKIAPLLQANCAQCHGAASPGGGLAMASLSSVLTGGRHGPALDPGNSKQSLLMQYVRGERTPRMPMGGTLPEETIASLAAAIDGMQALPKTAEKLDSHLEWLLHNLRPLRSRR